NSNTQNDIVIINGPKALFNPSSTNTFITLPVTFYNYSNTYNTTNPQYNWSFGDGTRSVNYSPDHTYPNPGQYTVRLIAKDDGTKCADTSIQVITVNNFDPAFSLTKTFLNSGNCPPLLVRFSNNSVN